MLLFKNGKFHCGNLSFILPDNSLLLSSEADMSPNYGFVFADTNQHYKVTVNEFHSEVAVSQALLEVVADISTKPVEIKPYRKNGLSGLYAIYHDSRDNHYLEYSISAQSGIADIDGHLLNTLSIVVHAKSAEQIKSAFTDPLILDFLESIQLAK